MSRNILYAVIGALIVATAVAGYLYYDARQGGVAIEIDGDGVSIDGN